MKKGLLYLLLNILLFTASNDGLAQRNNICACCALYAIESRIMDNSLFPPAQIAAVKIKEVVVTTRGTKGCEENRDSNTFVVKKTLAGEYTDFRFRFNINGTLKNYLRAYSGDLNHICEFSYRNNNKLVTVKESSVDSSGKILFPAAPGDLTDFFYNDKMKLVSEKKRGYAGNVEHDDTATFYKYRYDNKNRMVQRFDQTYFNSAEIFRGTAKTIYSLTSYESTTTDSAWSTLVNRTTLVSTSSTTYDSLWRPLKIVTKNPFNPVTVTELFEYNKAGKLAAYKQITNPPRTFECPEDGNYTITFNYNRFGLPVHLKHCYKDFSCDMEFTYSYY